MCVLLLKPSNIAFINLMNLRAKKADAIALQEIIFNIDDAQAKQAIAEAQAIANGVKAARNIANMPPNICTPAYLAEQAKKLAETSTALFPRCD